jgi:hypothetical protein
MGVLRGLTRSRSVTEARRPSEDHERARMQRDNPDLDDQNAEVLIVLRCRGECRSAWQREQSESRLSGSSRPPSSRGMT